MKEHDFKEFTFSIEETQEILENLKRDNPEGEEAFEKSQEQRISLGKSQIGQRRY